MRKINFLFLLAFLFLSAAGFSQNKTSDKKTDAVEKNDICTPLKPADAHPYTFSSHEELKSSVPAKKEKLISMIRENEKNAELVKQYREELWRLENAIVVEPK